MVFRDVDEIAEDVYRRSSARLSELRAANQRVAAELAALTEQTAEKIRQTVQRAEYETQEAGRRSDEQATALDNELSAPGETVQPALGDMYDQREAIARSAAARRSGTVVTPIDDDGDDEAEYYRRRSWLV
ncbi:hypothetical protein [Nocardia carnea]|uniref:hypothetical protein n=1 Tax=Nocardia carnea TaxID=37328 RepID=UPI00245871D3|nr:hypothetical protein [Nocardia carnea]